MDLKLKLIFQLILLINLIINESFTYSILSSINSNQSFSSSALLGDSNVPLSCSLIYCTGPLLDTVQQSQIYADSKTFVDMPLKRSPEITIGKFHSLMELNNNHLTTDQIKKFVNENFNEVGKELENWIPNDWQEEPRFLDNIHDTELRQWGKELNELWKILGRKIKPEVEKNSNLYSIIYVNNPFIVPGGRFREFYYWDSYWIIRGLLRCEMYSTAKGMLKNFLSIIDKYGFIPNGGRVYYLKRSQPPFLGPMIKSYVDDTGDDLFGIQSVELLEKEFKFFWNNYIHNINNYKLAAYGGIKSTGPRPESYSEDVKIANKFNTVEEKETFYYHIKTAAESGMDFSSRFFITENGSVYGTLKDIKAANIIPVDLNVYLYWNAKIIAEFYLKDGNLIKANEYEEIAKNLMIAINAILWDDDVGVWLDYDIEKKQRRNYFVTTNLSPLWLKCYNLNDKEKISKKVLNYLLDITKVDKFPGGVPNTLYRSTEQWDLPNVWPPMQYMLIMGLDNLGTIDAKNLAKKWSERWVLSNYAAYRDHKQMYEKYNAEEFGGHGGGGEYDTQIGFGWTNGVIIELLEKYGHSLKSIKSDHNSSCSIFVFNGLTIFVSIILLLLNK